MKEGHQQFYGKSQSVRATYVTAKAGNMAGLAADEALFN